MAENTKIEWATHTVNFWWGCMKVSEGCANCYAETLSHRFGKSIWGPPSTTDRERKSGAIANMRKWDRQAAKSGEVVRVLAQSMSDFFEDHPQLPAWRNEAFGVIEECENLVVMLLTKRPENIMRMVPKSWIHDWPEHVWIGTSVENQNAAKKRIPHLLAVPAAVRFLSCEPLLGEVSIAEYYREEGNGAYSVWADYIDWVIVGGESGNNARPMHPDWARSIRDQCVAADVAFHFKQWGNWSPMLHADSSGEMHFWPSGGASQNVGKHAAGRMLDGRTWDEFPGTTTA